MRFGKRRKRPTVHAVGQPQASLGDDLRLLVARGLVWQLQQRSPLPGIQSAEFKVFSQFGDDGIIQYLIHVVPGLADTFVEFGVQDYSESNTRFLLANDNWRGLILDAGEAEIASVQARDDYWRYDLTSVHAFIDRDNIDRLIGDAGFRGEIGLMSVDIDGNDYWVWERIEVVKPTIVIAEYNSLFGSTRAVTIPYDPAFDRTRAHSSNLYWGASLPALCRLADRKGYAFVGSNRAGNNAYFVQRDRLGPLRPLSADEGYQECRYRESRDPEGRLTYLSGSARLEAIEDMQVHDLESDTLVRLRDL